MSSKAKTVQHVTDGHIFAYLAFPEDEVWTNQAKSNAYGRCLVCAEDVPRSSNAELCFIQTSLRAMLEEKQVFIDQYRWFKEYLKEHGLT